MTCRLSALAALLACGVLAPIPGAAQDVHGQAKRVAPLALQDMGSFFVGGAQVLQTAEQTAYADGRVPVDQMYVQYMIPAAKRLAVPLVLVHGGTLTGKVYETTPDGRKGWAEFFVRNNHPVYVPDQVNRGRSGFNQAVFNEVGQGSRPPSALPALTRETDESSWAEFRFGPKFGQAYPDTQFPVEAAGEFLKQSLPDPWDYAAEGSDRPNPALEANAKALALLGAQLKGAVVFGHSQSGRFPLEAAILDPASVKGMVIIEPTDCHGKKYTDAQIAALTKAPILAVFGDHLTGFWQKALKDCKELIKRVNAAGGAASLLSPPALGIKGNSHMLMIDRNSDQIASLIREWISANVK